MKSAPLHIIRVGLGITFLWIGVLIIRQPDMWGKLLQPWAVNLLPIPLQTAMLQTAAFDIIVGLLLLLDLFTFWAAAFALLHLVTVITVVGITPPTTRDIGLAAGALAIVWAWWPWRRTP